MEEQSDDGELNDYENFKKVGSRSTEVDLFQNLSVGGWCFISGTCSL